MLADLEAGSISVFAETRKRSGKGIFNREMIQNVKRESKRKGKFESAPTDGDGYVGIGCRGSGGLWVMWNRG